MYERVKSMFIKEFIQIFRDPRMKGVVFLMPIIQLLVFGYAVTTDVRRVPLVVHDLDRSAASRELLGRFVHSGYFEVREFAAGEERVRELMDRGVATAALCFAKGFEKDLLERRIHYR